MAHSVLLGLLAFLCAIFVDLQVKAVNNASQSTSHSTNSAVEQATDRISCAADNTTYTDTTSASSFALITFMLASLAQMVHQLNIQHRGKLCCQSRIWSSTGSGSGARECLRCRRLHMHHLSCHTSCRSPSGRLLASKRIHLLRLVVRVQQCWRLRVARQLRVFCGAQPCLQIV